MRVARPCWGPSELFKYLSSCPFDSTICAGGWCVCIAINPSPDECAEPLRALTLAIRRVSLVAHDATEVFILTKNTHWQLSVVSLTPSILMVGRSRACTRAAAAMLQCIDRLMLQLHQRKHAIMPSNLH